MRYLLIDGSFLEKLVADKLKFLGVEHEAPINFDTFTNYNFQRYDRIFYYDALPIKKRSTDTVQHEEILKRKTTYLDNIREQKLFHVKDGVTRLRNGTTSRLEQKGVDILIAVDAIKFALMGIVDEISIITSDLDFYPVFEALAETKARGVLFYDPDRTSKELIYSADVAEPLNYERIVSFLHKDLQHELSVSQSNLGSSSNAIISPSPDINIHLSKTGGIYRAWYVQKSTTYSSKNLRGLSLVLSRDTNQKIDLSDNQFN